MTKYDCDCEFYNHLILSGTKIILSYRIHIYEFYNHLILSGTKISRGSESFRDKFYNHLILSGTKINWESMTEVASFTIT